MDNPFAERLQYEMDRHRVHGEPLTDAVLAGVLGLNRSSVHKWMRGLSVPDERNMKRLARIFKWEDDSDVWLDLGKIPPKVLTFLCDTPEGRKTWKHIQKLYRASVHDPEQT